MDDIYDLQDRIEELEDMLNDTEDMLNDTEDMLGEAGQKLFEIRQICHAELRVIEQEGGVCGGYKRILAVLEGKEE